MQLSEQGQMPERVLSSASSFLPPSMGETPQLPAPAAAVTVGSSGDGGFQRRVCFC